MSEASAGLRAQVESKIRANFARLGSTLFRLTWVTRETPARHAIPTLRASVPRPPKSSTPEPAGWATPVVTELQNTLGELHRDEAEHEVWTAHRHHPPVATGATRWRRVRQARPRALALAHGAAARVGRVRSAVFEVKPILADIVRLADERERRMNRPIAIGAAITYGFNVDFSLSPGAPWGPVRQMPRA